MECGTRQLPIASAVLEKTPVSSRLVCERRTGGSRATFTRPWTISMPRYRRVEKNAKVLEYKCVEFADTRGL